MDGEKSVDIFGFFCYPKGAKKLPAFIWNQGGLYQASTYFPELGAKRGYAALCIDFPIPGYRSTGGYPINSEPTMGDDPRQAPIYHGAVALLKAVSFLQSRPEVDKDRIGMCGSSWGGFFTTLMAGVDPRLKAASAMFGTGSLQLGNSWWDGNGGSARRSAEFREKWRTTLDPAWRLQYAKIPIQWITGTDDMFYWMPAVMKTYDIAAGPKNLALLPNWDHALTPNLDEEVFAWLDVYLQGKPAFLQVTPVKVVVNTAEKARFAQWTFNGPRKVTSAEIIFSYGEAGNWSHRYWQTTKARIDGNTCSVRLPAGTLPYYFSGTVIDEENFRYSTPLVFEPASRTGRDIFSGYNGASEWGGFEEAHEQYAKLHGYGYPPVGTDARSGKGAGVLKAGKLTLPPLLFTAGLPHSFVAYMKADKPAKITVTLSGNFDGKVQTEQKEFDVETKWVPVQLNFNPPKALAASLAATITVPEGVTVLIDDVYFSPTANVPF
jgi:dienelactone hydrolase